MSYKSDIAHDDKVIELSKQYVAAYHNLKDAINEYGIASNEVGEALRVLNAIKKAIRKQQAADRDRKRRIANHATLSTRQNY